MAVRRWLARIPFSPLLIAASFLVGWFVPAFYDWTGSDQSRPSPLIGQTALGLIIGGIIVFAALPWLPIAQEPRDTNPSVPVRFRIRTLLWMTTAVAVVIAVWIKFPMLVSGLVCAIAFCYVVRFGILCPAYRWQIAALMACMYLPYVWVIPNDDFDFRLTFLWMASGLPAFVPTLLASRLIGQHPEGLIWLSMLLTGTELMFGLWVIRLGPKRAIAYLVFVLLMSLFGSFVLNAMMRV